MNSFQVFDDCDPSRFDVVHLEHRLPMYALRRKPGSMKTIAQALAAFSSQPSDAEEKS
jgi:hypothetical protein